jgi:hypothetical protein
MTLEDSEFKEYFSSSEGRGLYKYNEKVGAHCYALSVDAIVNDAEKRNSVFLDIITKTPSKANIPLEAVSQI